MRDKWPDREEELDDFFRDKFAEAKDESFLHDFSWDKISEQLDILGQIPSTSISGIESSSSLSGSVAVQNSSLITSSFLTVKTIVVSTAVLIGLTSTIAYLYLSNPSTETNSDKKDKVNIYHSDSLKESKSVITTDSNASNTEITTQESSKKGYNIITTQDSSAHVEIITPENAYYDKNLSENNSSTENNKTLEPNKEVETTKEPIIISEEADRKPQTTISGTTEPAKDFREKQLEKAKKKARPIFTPEK